MVNIPKKALKTEKYVNFLNKNSWRIAKKQTIQKQYVAISATVFKHLPAPASKKANFRQSIFPKKIKAHPQNSNYYARLIILFSYLLYPPVILQRIKTRLHTDY